eukprot:1141771-Pelagomonas_calceolata.AAC.2
MKKQVNGDQEIIFSSRPCLIRVEKNIIKSAPGSIKFIVVLDRKIIKLQSKLGDVVSFRAKLSKGLQSVRGIDGAAHTKQNETTNIMSGRLEVIL